MFTRFNPLNKKKLAFFSKLIIFRNHILDLAQDGVVELNHNANIANEEIKALLNGCKVTIYNGFPVRTLNADIVTKMRPIMKHKVAMFNALVRFMDATLSGSTDDDTLVILNENHVLDDLDCVDGEIVAIFDSSAADTMANVLTYAHGNDVGTTCDCYENAMSFIRSKGLYREYIDYLSRL